MMFDGGNGQKDKFVRLDDWDSSSSISSDPHGVIKCGFGIDKLNCVKPATKTPSSKVKRGMTTSSEGLRSIGRSLRFGVSRAVFPEDLNVYEKKVFDPQDKFLQLWNKFFVVSCILSVFVDPFFFYLPIVNPGSYCLGIDRRLAAAATTVRTIIDVFYVVRMILQFRTAYIAPSSRVFGRGELVTDPAQIARRYLRTYFIVDFLAVLPLPQIVIWRYLHRLKGSDVYATKQALLCIVLLQYIPRFVRIIPLFSELKRTSGVFAETAWAGAAYYLLLYMLCSHIVGALWYLAGMERNDACWQGACSNRTDCEKDFLYCDDQQKTSEYATWSNISKSVLDAGCNATDASPFDFGIFGQALSSGIFASNSFVSKYCYCLWWGLQNLSTLGQGLQTSTYTGEVLFSIALAIFGLILFALLIGNMQTYLQSLTLRLEEMRVKRRDSEQWMRHRLLPQELRERVRRYDQYKWLETRGVDEESLVSTLPKDLRRDIKRHLCLALVRRVPLFENMDERLLDAICERLKPSLYTENTYILREGDPVDEMLFIIRGHLESETTDGGRSGFLNRSSLKEGAFCGDELLTWALDPRSGSNLPSSTRTVRALTEVEAFALEAEELKYVASQFRRLHSRQVQHTFRFYSQQWRTWAARFIQAAWRRHLKRKLELRHKEEEVVEGLNEGLKNVGSGSVSLGATLLASRFAGKAMRNVHRSRLEKGISARDLVKFPKPPEPDFSADRD
ncbi:putative cyclic nucleotide-gated ion channel 5 [Silene latifolia]|uniref:putative cyclic nucleotide-gated ion channel 5 n=1 Tax=Silene latifolia TaxID=37657 RepID=UPI003D76A7A6